MTLISRMMAAALLILLLAACDKTPVPPMVFGASTWPGYEPVYLAQEQGYLATVNLRLAEYASVAEVKKALRDHALQAAAIPLDEALQLRRDIPDLKIVLLLDESGSADASPAQPGNSGAPGKVLNVLVVRDNDLGKYHSELMELVQGWQRALEFIRAQPDKAMQSMAAHEKVTPDQFSKAIQGIELLGMQRNRDLMLGDPPAVGASVDAAQRFLLERGLINMGADASTLLDTSLLPKDKP